MCPPATIARAESRKRKETDASKAIVKKRKAAKNAKDATTEEVVESTHDGTDATRLSARAGQSVSSIARPHEDLMSSSVQAMVAISGIEVSGVAPLPCILSDDSSESEGNTAVVASTSASDSEEVASDRHGHSVKAQHLEESKADSKEQPALVLPQNPEASAGPANAGDTGMPDVAGDALYLRKFIFGAM